jgi:hypothetical protein
VLGYSKVKAEKYGLASPQNDGDLMTLLQTKAVRMVLIPIKKQRSIIASVLNDSTYRKLITEPNSDNE